MLSLMSGKFRPRLERVCRREQRIQVLGAETLQKDRHQARQDGRRRL
jgi:hypothetical protein